MWYLKYILIAFGALSPLVTCKLDLRKGSYMVDIIYVRSCPENNLNLFQLHISHRKYNRTHIGIDMNITLPEMFDHTYELEAEFRLWGDGGWKNKFFHLRRQNACTTLYLIMGPVWTNIIDAAKCNRGCPVTPGFYSFKDYFLDLSKLPVIVQPGRFFVYVKAIKKLRVVDCFETEIVIKQGFYSFKDYFIDLSNLPIIVKPGRFFLYVPTRKNSKIVACAEAEMVIHRVIV